MGELAASRLLVLTGRMGAFFYIGDMGYEGVIQICCIISLGTYIHSIEY